MAQRLPPLICAIEVVKHTPQLGDADPLEHVRVRVTVGKSGVRAAQVRGKLGFGVDAVERQGLGVPARTRKADSAHSARLGTRRSALVIYRCRPRGAHLSVPRHIARSTCSR